MAFFSFSLNIIQSKIEKVTGPLIAATIGGSFFFYLVAVGNCSVAVMVAVQMQ